MKAERKKAAAGSSEADAANETRLDTESSEGEMLELADDDNESATGSKRKTKDMSNEIKTRLLLSTSAEHPFSLFLTEAKKRSIKNFDPANVILEALDQVDEAWWEEKLDSLTPLEYKITAALSDPNMREKLTSLLASQKLAGEGHEGSLQ